LPARLEPLEDRRVALEARRDSRGHAAARLDLGSRRLYLRRRGGPGVRAPPLARAAARTCAARALVQPLRPPPRVAGDDAPPRGGGVVLLPTLLHGSAARRRIAQARGGALPRIRGGLRHLPVVSLPRPPARQRRVLAAQAWRAARAHRPELVRLASAERARVVRSPDARARTVRRHAHA